MIADIYSKRQKELRGELPDVFVYEAIPDTFRVQVVHIIRDALGTSNDYSRGEASSEAYKIVHDVLSREYGLFSLIDQPIRQSSDHEVFLMSFLLQCNYHERVLDVIELSFRLIEHYNPMESYRNRVVLRTTSDKAIEELNARFLANGVGYQYESREIIRVDSQIIHAEAVQLALALLREPIYQGANEEFLRAHEHYRHGRHQECLNECLKAFESTMKAICDKRGWAYDTRSTASGLITICFDNELIPSFLQSQFSSLRSSLGSGIPTVRNRMSGHGQGTQQITVPAYLAGYVLHLTATNILLLAKAEAELP